MLENFAFVCSIELEIVSIRKNSVFVGAIDIYFSNFYVTHEHFSHILRNLLNMLTQLEKLTSCFRHRHSKLLQSSIKRMTNKMCIE